jgi:YesN/AraC family two-component response regulator
VRRTDALPAEKLDYVDVTIVLSGSMEYAINRQKASLRAGDAVVFHVGDVRERKEGGSAEYYSFNVSPDPGDGLPRLSGVLRGALTEEAGMLLDLFQRSFSSGSRHEREKCVCCFCALYWLLEEQSFDKSALPAVAAIRRYVSEHLAEPLTASGIASAVFLSPNYCGSLFRRHTGQTLMGYVISEKMEAARKRVLSSNEELSAVAASLGYTDYPYFSRLFKRHTGLSPARYRRVHSYNNDDHGQITDFTAKD